MERRRLTADAALHINQQLASSSKDSGKGHGARTQTRTTRASRASRATATPETPAAESTVNAVNKDTVNTVGNGTASTVNTVDVTKYTTGRPSKYDSKYCEVVIEHGMKGHSITAMANAIGVHRDTLYEWATAHAEFSYTLRIAMQLAEEYWEKKGIAGMDAATKDFNAALWKFWMSCRFPDNYREVRGTELSTPPGRPLQTQDMPITAEQAAREYKSLMD